MCHLVVDEHALSPVDILQLQHRRVLPQDLVLPELPNIVASYSASHYELMVDFTLAIIQGDHGGLTLCFC